MRSCTYSRRMNNASTSMQGSLCSRAACSTSAILPSGLSLLHLIRLKSPSSFLDMLIPISLHRCPSNLRHVLVRRNISAHYSRSLEPNAEETAPTSLSRIGVGTDVPKRNCSVTERGPTALCRICSCRRLHRPNAGRESLPAQR